MNRRISFLLALFLFGSSVIYGQKKEEKAVRTCFENYKEAISKEKGPLAAQYVDSRTIGYYSDMLELVKQADSAAVQALSVMDKLMVFSIRHRTPKEDILAFSGRDLLIYAINEGMIGKDNLQSASIGEVVIKDQKAEGQFLHYGDPAPFSFHFYREDDSWKIDLTSIFPISNMAFENMVAESGEPEDAYLFGLLAILTGRTPGREIWQPIAQ
jgi:hypothetical protein